MPSPWARHAPCVDTEPLRDQCTGNPGDKEALSQRGLVQRWGLSSRVLWGSPRAMSHPHLQPGVAMVRGLMRGLSCEAPPLSWAACADQQARHLALPPARPGGTGSLPWW